MLVGTDGFADCCIAVANNLSTVEKSIKASCFLQYF